MATVDNEKRMTPILDGTYLEIIKQYIYTVTAKYVSCVGKNNIWWLDIYKLYIQLQDVYEGTLQTSEMRHH